MKEYDVLIIGAGPAGLTAGIYAARAGAKVGIVEKSAPGGKANLANDLENYMGTDGISGSDLMIKSFAQAEKYGAEFIFDEVTGVFPDENKAVLKGGDVKYKSLILAVGTYDRKTGVENEKDFIGRGVSYCAVCDGNFFKGKTVVVAGGGNTAFKDALYLATIANKVYIVHRREGFRAEKILVERAKNNEKIEFVLNGVINAFHGNEKLESVDVKFKDGGVKTIETDGVFVALGAEPETGFIPSEIKKDDKGYIVTDDKMQTSVKGIFAAGDVREKNLRQIVTASSDGAVAGQFAAEYALENFDNRQNM